MRAHPHPHPRRSLARVAPAACVVVAWKSSSHPSRTSSCTCARQVTTQPWPWPPLARPERRASCNRPDLPRRWSTAPSPAHPPAPIWPSSLPPSALHGTTRSGPPAEMADRCRAAPAVPRPGRPGHHGCCRQPGGAARPRSCPTAGPPAARPAPASSGASRRPHGAPPSERWLAGQPQATA